MFKQPIFGGKIGHQIQKQKYDEEIRVIIKASKRFMSWQEAERIWLNQREKRKKDIIDRLNRMNQNPAVCIHTDPVFVKTLYSMLNDEYFDENKKQIRSLDFIPF